MREDDATLVARTLVGDREAFGELVTRYERMIGALCRQKIADAGEAEDVVQDSFLKAYEALADLRDRSRFAPWLYGIAFRSAIDAQRRRGRKGRVLSLEAVAGDGAADVGAGTESAADHADRREQAERVLEELGRLPERYRLVLTLRFQRHMGYQEIADHLHEPAGTIANRLHRAVALLKERMLARAPVSDSASRDDERSS